MSVRVVLVDDQALIRTGFKMILETEDDIDVVGEASDGEQAIAIVRSVRPDVVLMDVQMPTMDGLEATGRISRDASIQVGLSSLLLSSARTMSSKGFAPVQAGSCSRIPLPKNSCTRCASSPPAMRFSHRRSPARSLKGSSADR